MKDRPIVNPKDVPPRPSPDACPLAAPGEPICGQELTTNLRKYNCQRKAGHDGPHSAVSPGMTAEAAAIRQGQRQADEQALEYRRQHFAVECRPNHLNGPDENELVLRVTQNGRQWTSTGILPEEVPAVVSALQQAALEAHWSQMVADAESGADKPIPYADAFVAFQAAQARYDKACRAMAWDWTGRDEQWKEDLREEWRLAGVHMLALYSSILGQLQAAGLLPLPPLAPFMPTPRKAAPDA